MRDFVTLVRGEDDLLECFWRLDDAIYILTKYSGRKLDVMLAGLRINDGK